MEIYGNTFELCRWYTHTFENSTEIPKMIKHNFKFKFFLFSIKMNRITYVEWQTTFENAKDIEKGIKMSTNAILFFFSVWLNAKKKHRKCLLSYSLCFEQYESRV